MKTFLRVLGAAAGTCFVLLLITITVSILKRTWLGKDSTRKPHVAIVDLTGIILSSSATLREINELLENPSVKAIVVRINSPGGLVAPSQEIYEGLRRADKKVPVMISMGSLAASGGYYAALGGRKIWANPGTLTASIGVIMEFVNTQKLYNWAKIERFALKAGKFKDIGSPLKPMLPEERELLTRMLSDIHEQFRATVKERRKLTSEELNTFADGRVMTGHQALEAKLVDSLGGLDDVLKETKHVAGLPESAHVKYPDTKGGLLRKLFGAGDADDETDSLFDRLVRSWTPPFSPGWHVLLLAPIE